MLKYVAASFIVAVGILLALPTPFDPVAFRYAYITRRGTRIISEYSFSTDGTPEFTGPLTVNQHIAKARRVFEDAVQGPESFAAANGTYQISVTLDRAYVHCILIRCISRIRLYRP